MKNNIIRWKNAGKQQQQQHNQNKQHSTNQAVAALASATTATCYSNNALHFKTAATDTEQQHVAVALQCQQQQPACCSSTTSTYAATDAIDCDNNQFIDLIFLAQKTNTTNFSKHSVKQQQQQQQQQALLSHSGHRRTLTHLNFSKFLIFCLHISAVVFLCNLNVGLNAVSAALSERSSETEYSLKYELDYELPESVSVLPLPKNDKLIDNNDVGGKHYTHTWAVHIPNGDTGLADQVAREHGFINNGKIFDDHYHFSHHKVSKRSLEPALEHQSRLQDDHRVHWAKQQRAKSRQKRDFISMRSSRVASLINAVPFSDPKWPQMWYLNRGGGLDMNVIPAWKEGITGKGVVVTILDDGLESDHPDIEQNYDPKASYDVNNHDDDPMPHYDMTDSNRHGTRCAGEVAATANNSICAVGIAYGASVGGVRMLDGDVTDAVEARSLSLNSQHIDIYSASWGPDDDGKTVDGPGELASRAFIEGVNKGRQGKGSIFIWASGNGGREQDNCNCDGYTNSIWTLSISSATEEGHVPWYSEKCSSTLATTYSSGAPNEKQVVTTDLHHSCTVSHTGTSASAPLAAGIAALVLESNNNLTWRDLQHIVVRTAKPANLQDPTWSKNGVGRRISHSFGYGLMDAAEMVRLARTWKTVPEQQRCEINAPHVDKVIRPKNYITLQLSVKHCLSVNYLEHVQAKITLSSQRRGDIQLYLKSPAGTRVTLLTSRFHDSSRSGFNQWPFMSVHTWGESPHGDWQLEIHNEGRQMAQILQWDLIFYGTETPAQPDDKPNSGQFSSFDDIDNGIAYPPSGQFSSVQEVGESQHMSIDKTNTACVKTTVDQKCLACDTTTYFYNGHCYDQCPVQTYVMNNKTLIEHAEMNDNKVNLSDDQEALQSIDRRKRGRTSALAMPAHDVQNICANCDVSCMRCYGPANYQCSTCYPGSQLRKQAHSNETYCYVFAERSSGNNHADELEGIEKINGYKLSLKQLLIAPLLMSVAFMALVIFRKYKSTHNQTNTMNYDRVALLPDVNTENDDDEVYVKLAQPSILYREEMPERQTALIDCVISDASESEEEVFDVTSNNQNLIL